MSKYKIGEKVVIKDKESLSNNKKANSGGGMKKWSSKVMTIRKITSSDVSNDGIAYKMIEDSAEFLGNGWYWYNDMISTSFDNYDEYENYWDWYYSTLSRNSLAKTSKLLKNKNLEVFTTQLKFINKYLKRRVS